MFKKNEVFRNLVSAGVCASVLLSCNRSEKRDLENQKGQFQQQTEKAKSEAQKNQELNLKLQQLISESEALKADLKQKEIEFSRQRSEREHQISLLNDEIRDTSAKLHQMEKKMEDLRTEISKQELILSQTRESIIQEKKDLEAEILKAKNELAQEEKLKKEQYAQTEASLKSKLTDLEKKKQDVDNQEKALIAAQTALSQAQQTLKSAQEKLASDQKTLNARISKFSSDVAAARDLFIQSGQGDVFEKIQADHNFAFRASLWGMASVENIEMVRQQIVDFNNSQGLKTDNSHKSYVPLFEPPAPRGTAKKENVKYIKNNKELSRVDDSFIITGTASEVKTFRDKINLKLAEIAKKTGAMNANIWLTLKPVQQVRLNMTISLFGSRDMGFERKEERFYNMTKVRPLDTPIRSLENIDLSKPSQLILGKNKQNICNVVSKECIAEIKKLGVLNHKTSFELTNLDGSIEKFEGTYADYFERLIDVSLTKLKLENQIKQAQQDGFEITVTQKMIPVEKTGFFGRKYTEFEIIENKDMSAIDVYLKDKAVLDNLAQQAVLERIEISYEVSMVEVFDGQTISLDMAKYFDAGTIGDSEIQSLELAQRGEIEIKLPIDLKSTNTSRSQFTDLTLKDFTPVGLTAPTKPEALQPYRQSGMDSRLVGSLSRQVKNSIQATLEKGETLDLNSFDEQSRKAVEVYAKMVRSNLAAEAYPKAMAAYEKALKEYNDKLYPLKMAEYNSRRQDLMLDLRDLLKELKK